MTDRALWLWQWLMRPWCRVFGHRDDFYDGPCCYRCGWHCADDLDKRRAGGS